MPFPLGFIRKNAGDLMSQEIILQLTGCGRKTLQFNGRNICFHSAYFSFNRTLSTN